MTTSYSFAMASPVPAEQVARELHTAGRSTGILDSSTTPEGLLDGVTTSLGTWVRVAEAAVAAGDPVVDDLGFTPAVSVTFRLGEDGDVTQQQDDMIRLVSGVFERVPGDAVLHREFEDIWLLRRGDALFLSEQDDLWPRDRRAALSQPYTRATHTFAEN